MSVENKIKELLERVDAKASLEEAGMMGASGVSKDSSIKAANSGDSSNPKQGDSKDATYETRDEKEANQGAQVSKGIKKNDIQMKGPVGAAPNFTTVGDPTSVVNKPSSSGNVAKEEVETEDEEAELKEANRTPKYASTDRKVAGGSGKGKHFSDATAADHRSALKFHQDQAEMEGHRQNDEGWTKHTTMAKQHLDALKGGPKNEEVISEEDTEEVTGETEEVIAEEETVEEAIDLSTIFGDDLSEDFKQKATAIFEAAVIAKVNSEMDQITEALAEKFAEETEAYKENIVEKVDSYLNYVVENWMEENKLAVENGLRTEIAEDFISGLKVLFKEHYIEVPEEKYDVIGELQSKVAELEEDLNTQIENNVGLNSEVTELKKILIISDLSEDLAETEKVKLNKLLEGIEFDNEELFEEKVKVIKENYFRADNTEITKTQALTEETEVGTPDFSGNDTITSYAKALSRSIKRI